MPYTRPRDGASQAQDTPLIFLKMPSRTSDKPSWSLSQVSPPSLLAPRPSPLSKLLLPFTIASRGNGIPAVRGVALHGILRSSTHTLIALGLLPNPPVTSLGAGLFEGEGGPFCCPAEPSPFAPGRCPTASPLPSSGLGHFSVANGPSRADRGISALPAPSWRGKARYPTGRGDSCTLTLLLHHSLTLCQSTHSFSFLPQDLEMEAPVSLSVSQDDFPRRNAEPVAGSMFWPHWTLYCPLALFWLPLGGEIVRAS